MNQFEEKIIDENKSLWFEKGKIEGKVDAKLEIFARMREAGYSHDSISRFIQFDVDEIVAARNRLIK